MPRKGKAASNSNEGTKAKRRKKTIQVSDEEESNEPTKTENKHLQEEVHTVEDPEEGPSTATPTKPPKANTLEGTEDIKASPSNATPTKSTEKPILKPIASPGAQTKAQNKESRVTVHVSALTWGAWTMSFRVYSSAKGKETDAWTGMEGEPGTIAHALKYNMTVAWIKEKRRSDQDQWHFVRLTPDIKCSKDGFAKVQKAVQSLFEDKKKEWNAKPEAEFTNSTQRWIKMSWNNQLTFTLTNSVYADGDLNPWPWDKYLSDRNILRLARDCFPGSSYRDLDTAGGFYGETKDEEGNLMTLEKASNPMAAKQEVQETVQHKHYDE